MFLFNFLSLYVVIVRNVIPATNMGLLLRWAKQLKEFYVNNSCIPLQFAKLLTGDQKLTTQTCTWQSSEIQKYGTATLHFNCVVFFNNMNLQF